MTAEARILLVDDNPADVRLIREALRDFPAALAIESVPSLAEAFRSLDSGKFDAVLLDLALPDGEGVETLRKARLAAPDVPIVVLTGNQDASLPIAAVRGGAQDYLVKGTFDGLLLTRTIRHAIERMRALQEVMESEERYRTLYERIDAGILEFDARGVLTSANPAFIEMLEYRRLADVLARRPDSELFCDPDEFRDWFAGAAKGSRRKGTKLRLQTARGRKVVALCSMHELRARDGALLGYQALLKDMTEVSRLSEQLSYEASHDSLTDLLNRRMFEALCRETLEAEGHIRRAFCYVDLDQFKIVNDTCGHLAGDELLKAVAAAVRERVEPGDVLARLGGDEFALLFRAQDESEACAGADRILKAIENVRFHWASHVFEITASIGLIPPDAKNDDFEQLLAAADTACHAAKDRGGGRVYVGQVGADTIDRKIREMHWVMRIKAALNENRLLLYQQPIVGANDPDGNFEHFEVLLRKVDSDGRIHSPAEFLPAVERYNYVATVDRWVVNATLDWLGAHKGSLRPMVCSVNLSGQSVGEPAFLDFIEQCLDRAGVAAELLCFEITESAAVRSLSAAQRLMSRLRARGCRFSLDDFGTGLSSFGYLQNLDVDFIKLDAIFVKSICSDPVSRAMVKSIAEIARAMGKCTVAEGVESRTAIDILRDLGVEYVQGFAIRAPAPLDTLLLPAVTCGQRVLGARGGETSHVNS